MNRPVFISRVLLHNFKSIGHCDARLGPLTYLVGPNGSGKSNFLDAMHLVRDALAGSLDNALNERGGIVEVRRRSSGHPVHFGMRLEFALPDGRKGHYAFSIGALKNGGYEVQNEECAVGGFGKGPYFHVERGQVKRCSETTFPALTSDRLALVAASGLANFRPMFDALVNMVFYNLDPKVMRVPQKLQKEGLLKPHGENIANVIGHLEHAAPQQILLIQEYLQTVVPMIHGIERRRTLGPMETLEFRQDMAGSPRPWKFSAQNMSDGTLRALGVLTAIFQGNPDFAPTLVCIEEPEAALHPAASAALREALNRAAQHTQVIVTSHSPDLLDDPDLDVDSLLAVVSDGGETQIAPLDEGSRASMRDQLFSAGELLRLNQLAPDPAALKARSQPQPDLFGWGEA